MQMERRMTSMMSDEQSEKLQLFFSCRNLTDLDFITVTDSFLVIKLQETNKSQKQIMKTKVYDNNLNPDYAQTVTIQYFFQVRQKLILEVYHQASPPKLIGKAETTVGQVFGSQNKGLKKPLVKGENQNRGEILVRCEVAGNSANKMLQVDIQAYNLPSSFSCFCFGSSNTPFFRIYRIRERDQLLIYQSEQIYNNQNPIFKRVRISERRLCKNDPDKNFQIRFYNYSITGAHSYIGQVTTTVNRLLDSQKFTILDKNNTTKGMVSFRNINRYIQHKFVDYISAGLQLLLITCIDFTASNGSPKYPQSLHYIENNRKSPYEDALQQISKILLDYDSDKMVPLYGFGAKVNMPTFQSYNKVHHCFPLNGNEQNAHVYMVQGIMQAYRQALQFYNLEAQQSINQCKLIQKQRNQYMILFILTDGQIHDRNQVIDQLIQCCNLPISIIIVGVGNGSFDIMHQLDDDDCQLVDSRGKKTSRDLVQFVEFKKFKNNGVQLAKEVLQQLPRQVQQYYKIMNISPSQLPKLPSQMGWQQSLYKQKGNPYGNI